jgi:hypothetical protein
MKYEYCVKVWQRDIYPACENDFQNMLNEFGNDGWELVSITPQIGSQSTTSDGPENITCCDKIYVVNNVVVFKKPMNY